MRFSVESIHSFDTLLLLIGQLCQILEYASLGTSNTSFIEFVELYDIQQSATRWACIVLSLKLKQTCIL